MRNRTRAHASRAALFAALVLALLTAGCARTVKIGGVEIEKDAVSADLRNAGVTDVSPLIGVTTLMNLDLRSNEIAQDDYDALQAALPACTILWSVPIAGTRVDSDAESLVLPGFTDADIPLLAYFPQLKSVDASGCTDYAALRDAAAAFPDCAFSWTVSIGGVSALQDAEALDLKGCSFAASDLADALTGLPQLKTVDVSDTGLDTAQLADIMAAYPDLTFIADVKLFDTLYPADTAALDLGGMTTLDVPALQAALANFHALSSVDLRGTAITDEEKLALLSAYPDVVFHWEVELLPGLTVDSGAEEIVITGYENPDVDTLMSKLAFLPHLKKLDLCACYEPGNDTNLLMEKLVAACPNTKIVWLVHVGNWELRTDITAFSMGNSKTFEGGHFMGGAKYPSATNERIEPLKYCTDLVALDIGHAKRVSDISCMAGLTKVRYLILGMTSIDNIDALAGMSELEFLELYQNWTSDFSPLLNCKKLKYLNISTTFADTIDDIIQMKQLKRLWIMRQQVLTKDDIAAIKAALPDTIIRSYMYAGGHSTIGGWRTKNPAYLRMQDDLFHLPLQDQNEKEVGDEEYWGWDLEAFEAE